MLVKDLQIDRLSLPGRFLAFALKVPGDVALLVDESVSEQDGIDMAQSMLDQMELLGTGKAWRLSER